MTQIIRLLVICLNVALHLLLFFSPCSRINQKHSYTCNRNIQLPGSMHFTFDNIRKLAQLADQQARFNIVGQLDGLVQLYAHYIHSLNDTIDTFSAHYAIQRDVTKHKHIDGWPNLLKNLKLEAEKGKNIGILQLHIMCETGGYLFFTTMDQQQLFGVLRFKKQAVSRATELDENGRLRGTWTSHTFFLKGAELF